MNLYVSILEVTSPRNEHHATTSTSKEVLSGNADANKNASTSVQMTTFRQYDTPSEPQTPLPSQSQRAPTDKEERDIDLLNGMMGGWIDRKQALRVLRSYNGNIEKAAIALLEDGTPGASEGALTFMPTTDPVESGSSRPRSPPRQCGILFLQHHVRGIY